MHIFQSASQHTAIQANHELVRVQKEPMTGDLPVSEFSTSVSCIKPYLKSLMITLPSFSELLFPF